MGQISGHNPSDSRSGAEIARTLAETAGRRRAVVIAGHSGDREIALAGLDDQAAAVRASALLALQRLGALTRSDLRTAFTDPDPKVRRTAAEIAATWVDPAGLGAPGDLASDLVQLLRDPAPEVVEVAAWACGERVPVDDDAPSESSDLDESGRDAVIQELIQLATSHDDTLVREASVAALGAIGDEHGLPAILQATSDKATVRRRAVIALAPFEGDAVDAALQQALEDRDWQVRQAAEDLLD